MTVQNSYLEDKVLVGDVLETLKSIQDNTFDFGFTSPPYNLKNSTCNGMKDGRGGKWENAKLISGYADYDDNMPHEEYVAWQRAVLTEMMRVIKDDGAFFYNHKWRVQAGLLQDRSDIVEGFPVRQILIWRRKGGINFNLCLFLTDVRSHLPHRKQGFQIRRWSQQVGRHMGNWARSSKPAPSTISLRVSRTSRTSMPRRIRH